MRAKERTRRKPRWEGEVGGQGQVPSVRGLPHSLSLGDSLPGAVPLEVLGLILLKKVEFPYVLYVPGTFLSILHTLSIEF